MTGTDDDELRPHGDGRTLGRRGSEGDGDGHGDGEMMVMVVVIVTVMVMVEFWSCVYVRAAIEESDEYVLSSLNIMGTHAVDAMRPSIACSVAPPLCSITDVTFQSLVS